jgi:hypothetical protein
MRADAAAERGLAGSAGSISPQVAVDGSRLLESDLALGALINTHSAGRVRIFEKVADIRPERALCRVCIR